MELNNFIESNCLNKEITNTIINNVNRINKWAKTNRGEELIFKTLPAYVDIDKKFNSDFAVVGVVETLGWLAEYTRNIKNVEIASACFLDEEIIKVLTKYKADISDEIFQQITGVIIIWLSQENVKNYISWLNNGIISKSLEIGNEFSKYENAKLKKNIFTLLSLNCDGIPKFNLYSSDIEKRRFSIDKKIELYSILKDVINSKKEDYAKILVKEGLRKLVRVVENDIGYKINKNAPSLRCGVMITEDRKKDPNVDFLIKKCVEKGNVKNWIYSDETTQSIIEKMRKIGFNTDLYIASGKKILEARSNGNFSEDWSECLKNIVIELVGKKNQTLPKVSIFNLSPKVIFKNIKDNFLKAIKKSKSDAKILLEKLDKIIEESYSKRKIPRPVSKILNEIRGLKKVIEYGGTLNFRGAKVTAKVWKRSIPNDLYNSDMLRCCIFLPYGEMKYEIPLFMMDPTTTLVQYFIQGIDEPIAAATFYAGVSENQPVLFVDTWEGGSLVYTALGNDKMKEFVLKSMLKFTKMAGAKKLLILEGAEYGRPEEFCNFLKKKYKTEEVYFESIDADYSVLNAHSKGEKYHITDAYFYDNTSKNFIKGKIKAFILEPI